MEGKDLRIIQHPTPDLLLVLGESLLGDDKHGGGGEMEGKDLRIIQHPTHDHSLVLRESLLGDDKYGGGCHQVYCDGCREPISSSSSSSSSSSGLGGGGGDFYACPHSDCWFLLHKRCAELPPKIEHPSHHDHALTLHPSLSGAHNCDVCCSKIDSFLYRCSDCDFDVHVRCASMVLRIQDRVDDNNKIHQHPLIRLEEEAQFLCYACGREHKGKSYLCSTCGFWANQICASTPTTVDLHNHPHPLTLFRSFRYSYRKCKICNKEVNKAYWGYHCSEECDYLIHVGCWLSMEKAENSNKDIEANRHLESTSHKIEIQADLKAWPLSNESAEVITQLIKNLNLQGTHKRATKILQCTENHPLIFVDKKINESKDDQLCDCCGQTISSQFYNCVQCDFSLHEWCAELPNELRHILHVKHPLHLISKRNMSFHICDSCHMRTTGFVFGCSTCEFYLDLKCASLPRLIKHQAHGHNLALRRMIYSDSCNACGEARSASPPLYCFLCEACNFKVCIKCVLLLFSVRHRYDRHPFALTYSSIEGQADDYYCEICEENIDSVYWFYHCIECDQSLHPECIYPFERSIDMMFGTCLKVNFHSHLLSCVSRPMADAKTRCHLCDAGFRSEYTVFECKQCNLVMHLGCVDRARKIFRESGS